MTERSPSSKRPPADPRPVVVFNMYNGKNAPGTEYEYGVENNVTNRYKRADGVNRLRDDILKAAELGFRRMMLHTVMGGGPGFLITGNGRFSIPPQKWNALRDMVGEVRDAYPDIEIGPHFACLYTMDLASPLGPKSGMNDLYYSEFPSLVGQSTWEKAFWVATREAWRDIGCTWMSGDNWMRNLTAPRAVEVTHEEWANRRFRIVNESIPVGQMEHHKAAELVDCWILSHTMVERKALAGPDYGVTPDGHGLGSLQPVPEHVRGHWYTYHWINRWPLIPGASNDAEAMALLMDLGWVVMHHDAERLDEACGLAGIDVETGLPVPQKPKPKPIEPSPRSPRDEPATDKPYHLQTLNEKLQQRINDYNAARRDLENAREAAHREIELHRDMLTEPEPKPIEPATDDSETDLRIDRKTLLRKAVAHVRMQLDGIENLIEEADDPDDEASPRSTRRDAEGGLNER